MRPFLRGQINKLVTEIIMRTVRKFTILTLFLGLSSLTFAADYDIVIKNGLVVDGSRSVGKIATVAIKGDKIVYVGPRQDLSAPKIIDAKGLVVSSGFIDVHNHAEMTVRMGKSLRNEGYLRQGVTTLVVGPDGNLSPEHIQKVQGYIKDNGSSTNVAVYVGHNAIRKQVMGMEPTLSNAKQLAEMKALVREGMELGAVGLSTGLMYTPGMYGDTAEVIELAKVAASFGGSYDSHVRNPVHELIKSYAEVIEIGRKAKIPVKIAHAKLVGLPNRALFPEIRKLVNDGRNEGINVVSDQYPYDGAYNIWLWQMVALPKGMMPESDKDHTREWVAALLNDPEKRRFLRKFNEKDTEGFSWVKAVGYTSMRVVVSAEQPDLVGKHISELAQELAKSEFDVIADMITNPELKINITLGSVLEENVRALITQQWNMISSDGVWSEEDMLISHPRSTGSFPRVLGKYVREEGLLDLPEAIYKMSAFPADFLGLGKRGYIREGYVADIAIFNQDTIIDQSDWVHPERLSTGMIYVLINGKLALQDEKMTKVMAGKFIKHRR